MRTLVISDLHLGGGERAWLHRPEVRAKLAAEIARVDRLVLLGDIVELRHARARDALAAARTVLPELVAGMGPGTEIIVLPGNHDHAFGAGWALRRSADGDAAELGLEQSLDWRDGEPLAALVALLSGGGASVRAAYPGVWLRDDIYAHHGHYLDRHTTVPFFERIGAGAMGRLLRTPVGLRGSVAEYERVLGPIYAWMYQISQAAGPTVDGSAGPSARIWQELRTGHGPRRWLLLKGTQALIAALNRTSLGPLSASVLTGGLEGAELPAYAAVLEALQVRAGWAIFGHTHRAGPFPLDDERAWTTASGIRLVNSGCWVYDEMFIDPGRAASSPYRPGFAVRIEGDGAPELINVLG